MSKQTSGMVSFMQHVCFRHTALRFPSSLSSLLLCTQRAHFSVCLINPFVVFHILFQSFLYIILCCLYLLVLHSMSSITQFVLFQAMWFPQIPFWMLVALLFLSISTCVILLWLLTLLFQFGVYFMSIVSHYVYNSNAIMILFYLILI